MIDCCYGDQDVSLTDNQKKRFKDFQSKYDTDEKTVKKQLSKEAEITILNSS